MTKNKKNILKIKFGLGTLLIVIASNIAFYTTSCQGNYNKKANRIVSNSSRLATSKQIIIKEKIENQTVEEKNVFYEDEEVLIIIDDSTFTDNNNWITCYEPIEVEEIFYIVEDMPQFPGGVDSLKKFIQSNIIFPEIYSETIIKGKVYVRFVVTDEGDVEQVQIARSLDPLLDEEAIRVVKLLPKWIPGKQRGHNVDVWFTFPVNFNLY